MSIIGSLRYDRWGGEGYMKVSERKRKRQLTGLLKETDRSSRRSPTRVGTHPDSAHDPAHRKWKLVLSTATKNFYSLIITVPVDIHMCTSIYLFIFCLYFLVFYYPAIYTCLVITIFYLKISIFFFVHLYINRSSVYSRVRVCVRLS